MLESTAAVFSMAPVADESTVPRIHIVLVAPLGKSPIPYGLNHAFHVAPPSVEKLALCTAAGRVSVRTICSAGEGPAFVTVSV